MGGSFSCSCTCINLVIYVILCECYTYSEDTKEIILERFGTTEEMVINIKIVNSTDNILGLGFYGEVIKFQK